MQNGNRAVTSHLRACNICEAICGLEIKVRDGDIISIKGDPDDPLSRGHICPKAVALQDLHNDPDRLREPMRRLRENGQRWEKIGWDDAFDLVAERLVDIRRQHGDDALAIYMGNPSVHNYGILTHQQALFSHLRTHNRYSATSVDQLPQHLVSLWMYGHKDLLPVPDIDHTDYLLILGANPIVSNGSIWTVPDVRKRIDALKHRGGKLVVLDPRRSETAQVANEYHPIRPGSDALFLAAMLHTLWTEELDEPGPFTGVADGLDQVRAALSAFTPEAVASATGIDADTIRHVAREFAAAGSAACYGRMGVTVQAFGTLNHWLIQLINLVSGNLDRVGGALLCEPAVNDASRVRPGHFGQFHSRVSGKPAFHGELPVTVLAEEILTPGAGQVKALFTCAGNPVLSTPNGRRLDQALSQLEFMVSLDPYINETTRHADIILPPTSPLEHDHYDIAFHTLAVRNTARFNEPVFAKPAHARHDWEIFTALGERVAALLGRETRAQRPPAELIDALLQSGPYGAASGHPAGLSLALLRQHPSGVDLGPLKPSLARQVRHEDGRIQCAIPACLADLERARAAMQPTTDLRLIGRRHIRSNNSWMHNYRRLVKGKDRSALLMHPQDMRERDIVAGTIVRVTSRVGSLEVRVASSDDMMPGVVSLPHGYGHQREGVKLSIAAGLDGGSFNDLSDHALDDPVSGNAVLNGFVVEVRPATAPS